MPRGPEAVERKAGSKGAVDFSGASGNLSVAAGFAKKAAAVQ